MQAMRYFIDTHDRQRGTFPAQLTPAEFAVFFQQYEVACQAEGVVPLRTHLSYADGRAFCLNMAADAEAVKRAHQQVGRTGGSAYSTHTNLAYRGHTPYILHFPATRIE